ncbi:uncharacterized protein VTP21DRAFT_2636 [Calcarisporiella thermophila]|uniref:uncharacterized protein n=1 Tax=Calcarisporiella thermophila TaxID=911321 RepID=UPI003742F330
MKRFFSVLLIVLVLLQALVQAAPMEDKSTTTLDVSEQRISPDTEELTVTVERVDDLVDDDGSLLAERIMSVSIKFDIKDNQLCLNGHPLQLGVSRVNVDAAIAAGPQIQTEEQMDVVENMFDRGIVAVEVLAQAERVLTLDAIEILRITVMERVVEVNGVTVVQTQAAQQVLEIDGLGKLIRHAPTLITISKMDEAINSPPPASAIDALPALPMSPVPNDDAAVSSEPDVLSEPEDDFVAKLTDWWMQQSDFVHFTISIAVGVVAALALLALRAIFVAVACFLLAKRHGYSSISQPIPPPQYENVVVTVKKTTTEEEVEEKKELLSSQE